MGSTAEKKPAQENIHSFVVNTNRKSILFLTNYKLIIQIGGYRPVVRYIQNMSSLWIFIKNRAGKTVMEFLPLICFTQIFLGNGPIFSWKESGPIAKYTDYRPTSTAKW